MVGYGAARLTHPTTRPSRRIRGPDTLVDLAAVIAFDDCDVVSGLPVEPELRAIAEMAPEPNRRIGGARHRFAGTLPLIEPTSDMCDDGLR
jgi:hypothetical protein